MAWPAVLPAAALRVMRTAACRRAVHLGLLVGVLFTVGFLCGEQAHAADRPAAPSVGATGAAGVRAAGATGPSGGATAAVTSLSATAADGPRSVAGPHAPRRQDAPSSPTGAPRPEATSYRVGHPRPGGSARAGDAPAAAGAVPAPASTRRTGAPDAVGARRPGGPASGGSVLDGAGAGGAGVRATAGGVVETVTGLVPRPVGDLVGSVTRDLAAAQVPVSPAALLPVLPAAPAPAAPAPAPGLPGLPGVPGASGRPGETPPPPADPARGARRTGPAAAPVPTVRGPVSRSGVTAGHRPSDAEFGPRSVSLVSLPGVVDLRAPGTGRSPMPQAPTGGPDGTLVTQSAVGNGAPRYADAQAVALAGIAPLPLLPGAAAPADSAGPRDRHRPIPVFPG
ncbi:hypothetical protein [Streptomyces tropicalis]|uniref:Uncharacterized protein n=1 Tax=Streptomyces tropicalis TaxID=3034234 RepID=A0ABT6A8T5_9ACTN|nr:hypothetical protein [Streptomyces tropicalis]MDF3301062.1 hypothetical protein [Streptomyces tropicalis]